MTEAHQATPPGATPEEWAHFSLVLGLTADLLPVVSNRAAKPAPNSRLRDIGKVPSVYTRDRQVVGIPKWTTRSSSARDIDRWSAEPDYGICVQTRHVRAIDVDIDGRTPARDVEQALIAALDGLCLPTRRRVNSAKFLAVFRLAGEHPKRVIRTAHGAIEFLGNGQQFVAAGTHPSGMRYEWAGGLPDDMPELSAEQFEALWTRLARHFAVEAPIEGKAKKPDRVPEAVERDEIAQHLLRGEWVRSTERDGRLHIRCPFEAEHTTESSESATTYWPAHTGGYERGHFRCLHAHCEGRTDDEFLQAVGYDPLGLDVVEKEGEKRERFALLPVRELIATVDNDYLIKHVLDRVALAIVYGESTAGKTFVVLDWAFHVALGRPWRDRRVRRGKVVYICAEGFGGFRKRLQAFCQQHGVDDVPGLRVIADAPSLLRSDHRVVAERITAWGGADLIVIDTLARTMAGGDENSAETVMKALGHCDTLHRATGAMVLLVAHSGKDQTKGVRGHSSIKPAADVQIEVLREGEGLGTRRAVKLEKVKDGPDEGKEFGFRLRTVKLGTDADGDEITSCVVEPVDEQGSLKGKAKRIGKVENAVLEVVASLAGLTGEAPTHDQVLDTYATKRAGEDKRERKNAADAARRAVRGLEEIGRLRVEDGRVFFAS